MPDVGVRIMLIGDCLWEVFGGGGAIPPPPGGGAPDGGPVPFVLV